MKPATIIKNSERQDLHEKRGEEMSCSFTGQGIRFSSERVENQFRETCDNNKKFGTTGFEPATPTTPR